MARKRKDLTGLVFGRLTVMQPIANIGTKWLCNCECGSKAIILSSALTRGDNRSCGCLRREIARSKTIAMRKGRFNVNSARNRVLRDYKRSAIKRNIIWELSESDFDSLITQPCHYCGSLPSNKTTTYNAHRNSAIRYNGIDRLDNTKNYTKDNVVPCCFICNRAKNTMPLKEWYHWISKIVRHRCKEDTIVISSDL